MATKPAEEPQGGLKYQTWVLKVSIHCEGCKRKVKKVLRSIEGVYRIDIDSQQHKVTVTGNVEAETLLKKLLRSNKHAELWPDPKKGKKSKKSKKKGEAGDEKNGDEGKDQEGDDNGSGDDDDDEDESEKEGGNLSNEAGGEQSIGDVANGGNGGGATSGAKTKKKKKKKKGSNGNQPNGGTGNPADANSAGANVPSMLGPDICHPMSALNLGPPIQHMYPGSYPPPMHYQPPQAPYGLSYSTMYPSASASYFTPAMHDNTYYQPEIYLPSHRANSDDDDDEEIGCYIM